MGCAISRVLRYGLGQPCNAVVDRSAAACQSMRCLDEHDRLAPGGDVEQNLAGTRSVVAARGPWAPAHAMHPASEAHRVGAECNRACKASRSRIDRGCVVNNLAERFRTVGSLASGQTRVSSHNDVLCVE